MGEKHEKGISNGLKLQLTQCLLHFQDFHEVCIRDVIYLSRLTRLVHVVWTNLPTLEIKLWIFSVVM